jgi:uncharacterized RDD family membrane protein YckC
MAQPAGLYAGFWRRAAAYVIDSLILLIPSFVISFVVHKPVAALLLQVVLMWLYWALMESSEGQATLGKKAFGIKVTDTAGERISFLRATGRFFGKYVSAIILGVGFLIAGLTSRKQALHDMMAGSLVVNRDAQPDEIESDTTTMPLTGGVWAMIVLLLIFPFGGGILAAIAIPAYQDYTIRAKVMNAIEAAGPSREAPGESPYVRRVAGDRASRQIEIFLDSSRLGTRQIEDGASIRYFHDGNSWKCSAQGVPPKYLPQSCR